MTLALLTNIRPYQCCMQHDSNLVEDARTGDLNAVAQLLAVCRPNLRRIAQSQCAEGVDPDDAVQESMLQIYRRIGALRTLAAFPAWTFSIVRRERHRLLRAMRGQVELPDADHPVFTFTEDPGLQWDLAAAIPSLPAKYREAIILRDFEEPSFSTIARSLRRTRAA